MSALQTHTLDAPGATLSYDVRGDLVTGNPPPLLMFGSPMDARGFGSLADRFADRTVITYDPRGAGRSARTDPTQESTPDQHADDLHRIIAALAVGPVDVFATSGGAVNALALVATHPEQVRTLVAHEPPLVELLPDRETGRAAVADILETYSRAGSGVAMAKFIGLTMRSGVLPDDLASEPAPDPAAFGMSADDDGARDDVLLAQNLRTCTGYQPDIAALRGASTRIVVVAGAESGDQMAARGARALADQLGSEAVVFPSHHGGFMGNEFGHPGDPDGFAAALHAALD